MADWELLSWPAERMSEALAATCAMLGLPAQAGEMIAPPAAALHEVDAFERWLESAAGALDLEAEPVSAPYTGVEALIERAAPAIIRCPCPTALRFLVLVRGGRGRAHLLAPDHALRSVPASELRDLLCHALEAEHDGAMTDLLQAAAVPPKRRARARRTLLAKVLTGRHIGDVWLLAPAPGLPFAGDGRRERLPRWLGFLFLTYAAAHVLWIFSWFLLGRGVLVDGRLDGGWLLSWVLLLATFVVLNVLGSWAEGRIGLIAGALLEHRLLHGALRLEPDAMRHEGVGHLLGRVFESNAFEMLALSGGFQTIAAMLEITAAAVVLGLGIGGWFHAAVLLCWLLVLVFMAWRFWRRHGRWTVTRIDLTNDLVEHIVGRRTRLAQEMPERWHEGEDEALVHYVHRAQAMDRTRTALGVLVPRLWLLVGLGSLAPFFIAAQTSPAALAVSVGGILWAYFALSRFAAGLTALAGAANAWTQAAPMFHAASRPVGRGSALANMAAPGEEPGDSPLIEARELHFHHQGRPEPTLVAASMRIRRGDRLLLEGSSGSGKSTLVSLLAGLRVAKSGLLLMNGLDRHTLGSEGWRRRLAVAPQFHENHIFSETFAFNLLMGRRWPPSEADLDECRAVCHELGLGDLLDRMPGGLQQMVGESGWQLSHGERNRVFLARALLQSADMVVLDESFAALDPESLRLATRCALRRARTLLVIIHP